MVWKREKIASNLVGYGLLGLLGVFFLFGAFDPNFRLIIDEARQRADRRADLPARLLHLVLDPRGGAERPADRGRAAADREGRVGQGLVWPDLVYTELISLVLCSVVLIVWSIVLKAPLEEPANRSVTPEPVEGAVVLPRPAGDAGLLRPVARRRRAARPDHRRPDGDPVHRHATRRATATTRSPSARREITLFLFGFLILWSC